MATVKEATNQALNAGAHPLVLQLAQKMLGKKEFIGWCQSFVNRIGGTTQGASAIQAWNNAQSKVAGTQGIQPGDLVYFSPNASNKGYGHTGVYEGNNQFISATNSGIARSDLSNWMRQTGQKLLGYVPQGERQAQVAQQMTQQPNQPAQQKQTPLSPMSMQIPTTAPQKVVLPNTLQQLSQPDQSTTTYGNVTVPNLI